MKMTVSTMEDFVWSGKRRDGNTTRQVDIAIQIIFRGHVCHCLDHNMAGFYDGANKRLFQMVMKRLWTEHSLSRGSLVVDDVKLTIEKA